MSRSGLRQAALAGVVLGMLVAAPSAFGQAAVEQYIPTPAPDGHSSDPSIGALPPTDGSSGGGGPTATAARSSAPAAGAGSGSGEAGSPGPDTESSLGTSGVVDLPGGYPVATFVLIVAALLAGTVVARMLWTRIGRKEGSV